MTVLPLWIILAVIGGLFSNGFNYLNRYILKDGDDPTIHAWYNESLRPLVFLSLAIWDWKLIINVQSIAILLLVGLTEMIAVNFYMRMHSYTHLSISTIASRTRLIWIPIFAFFLISEHLTLQEYLGIAILFFGLTFVVAPKKLVMDKGLIYANSAAIIIALNTVLFKMAFPYASNPIINASLGLPSLFLFPIFTKNFKQRVKTLKKNFLIKTVAVFCNIVALYFLTLGFRFGDVSKVMAVYQGMFIISVLAGIIFLRERQDVGKKIFGAIITLVGVLLLSK